tara:strand:+ start:249 stop:854 length:606 start_codon:yes stop_codon:yes gene_type:complete
VACDAAARASEPSAVIAAEAARATEAVRTAEASAAEAAKRASYLAAKAVLGQRFVNLREALRHPEFRRASLPQAQEFHNSLKDDEEAVAIALAAEEDRQAEQMEVILAKNGGEGCPRANVQWQEQVFRQLRDRASTALSMTDEERRAIQWSFELAQPEDMRYWALYVHPTAADPSTASSPPSHSCSTLALAASLCVLHMVI